MIFRAMLHCYGVICSQKLVVVYQTGIYDWSARPENTACRCSEMRTHT